MDRTSSFRPSERPYGPSGQAPPFASYSQPFAPPTAQPPLQIPNSDPFQTNRDPFLPASHSRRGSFGLGTRAWPPAQGNALPKAPHSHATPPPQHSQPFAPPPLATNGVASMALPYDPSRRRSLGAGSSGSPPLPSHGPPDLQSTHQLSSFQSRQMPPPSPPHLPSSASSLPASAPRGPPTASPFAGVRDLASFSSHRPAGGMSISSILGSGDDRNSQGSPNVHTNPTSTPKSMPPPSPGRARSSSMREAGARGIRDGSPQRSLFGEPRAAAGPPGHDRTSDPRRDGLLGSPQFQHGFRTFQPSPQEQRIDVNGHGPPGRPSSQPIEQGPPRSLDDIVRRDAPYEGRFATFRHFGEPQVPPARSDIMPRHENAPFQNGEGPTSQPADRERYTSPQMDRQRSNTGPTGFRPGSFGTPMREDQAGLFRPAYQSGMEGRREPLESGRFQEMRRDPPRSSPPLSDLAAAERARLGLTDRPMTFEEHQRMEAVQREQQQNRKESDSSVHRALLNISPELNRKGRNSPLPQAVQGAQTRHIGPGGDNPGIKMEFGRMFSGLGSGVGTATPPAGQSANGVSTPLRMSPATLVDGGNLVRTAVAEIEGSANGSKSGARAGKRNGRHARDEDDRFNGNGTETPDHLRGTKRSKTNHATHHHHHHVHPHHHHHHHHDPIDNSQSPFNMIRFPSTSAPQPNLAAPPAHHHHHHHTTHAHPGHHHHHVPRGLPARKPVVTVMSSPLVEECAKKPRTHLGSQLYTSELAVAPPAETPIDGKLKYTSRMKPIPVFAGKENCTYTVRVPRTYLSGESTVDGTLNSEHFQEICKHRNLWGTDVYTDDSDVVAAAVHSGWIKGDFGEYNDDLREVCGNESEQEEAGGDEPSTVLAARPRKPVKVPQSMDAHITVLILPPLQEYASTNQHHVRSREWKKTHDGMSFMIHRIEFVDESSSSRNAERSAKARKQRLAGEEAKRREAAAGLLMFAGGGGGGGGGRRGYVSVGA